MAATAGSRSAACLKVPLVVAVAPPGRGKSSDQEPRRARGRSTQIPRRPDRDRLPGDRPRRPAPAVHLRPDALDDDAPDHALHATTRGQGVTRTRNPRGSPAWGGCGAPPHGPPIGPHEGLLRESLPFATSSVSCCKFACKEYLE